MKLRRQPSSRDNRETAPFLLDQAAESGWVRALLACAWVALLAGLLASAPVRAEKTADGDGVTEIVVRLRDDALPGGGRRLSEEAVAEISAALRTPVVPAGRTADGAFRLRVAAMKYKAAREAVNRLRMLRPVLYAQAVADAKVATRKSDATGRSREPLPTNRLIVKYRDPALVQGARAGIALAPSMLERIEIGTGFRFESLRSGALGTYVLRLFAKVPASMMEAIAAQVALDPDVEYAEPDYLRQHTLVPNDPNYGSQWHYYDAAGGINLPNAWNMTTGAPGIVVAVVDTGYLPHPDLVGRFVSKGYDFVADCALANDGSPGPCTLPGGVPDHASRDYDAFDVGDWITAADANGSTYNGWFAGCPVENSSWHGTHVAGTIAAQTNNGFGVAGVTWKSRILPVRVLGKCGGYDSDIADGMVWAAGLAVAGVPGNPFPARVINLSLGGQSACGATYQNAINAILTAGTVIAIAAGNANHDASLDSPGNCNGVITVAATGRSGQRASYSNYGTLVELAAPGGSDGQYVLSTLNLGTTSPNLTQSGWTYVQYGGTSMATPHVAGVAALMLARNPSLTPAQVLSTMQSSARAFPSGTIRDCRSTGPLVAGSQLCGAGILDAGAAVAAVPLPKRRDRVFDANGYADLLWYSAASGSEAWLMNGLAPGITGPLRATPWFVAATGDFDGDGRTDIAWYNSVTGAAEATLMNGVIPGPNGALFTSLATQIVNTGDFNGDGKRDLLVRNAATGALQVFLMNGNTPGSTPTLFTDLNRVPSGVGDFNGDGKSDIVLRNTATGATEIVLLSGGAILTSAVIRVDPNWVVHRVGDFNGDGRSDILWRNVVTGATEIWLLNGLTPDATQPLLDGGFWQVVLTDDFDGDGRSDILWRHAVTGALAVWLMNDFAPTRGAAFPVDPDWSVLLTGDYNGDGKADLVLRNDANGQTVIWLMNGVAPVSSGVIRTSTSFAPIP